MKKNEFKKLIKPWIAETIQEVIMEGGFLSTIISEAIKGAMGANIIREQRRPQPQQPIAQPTYREVESELVPVWEMPHDSTQVNQMVLERQQEMQDFSVNAYNGVNIFEGVKPIKENASQSGPQESPNYSRSTGLAPEDPGLDISAFFKPRQG